MSEDADKGEQKTERFNMFMSPSEMKAIDEWAWKNKIRSKSEAVRRLCQMALILDENLVNISERNEYLKEQNDRAKSAIDDLDKYLDGLEDIVLEEKARSAVHATMMSLSAGFSTLSATFEILALVAHFQEDHQFETIMGDVEKAKRRLTKRFERYAARREEIK